MSTDNRPGMHHKPRLACLDGLRVVAAVAVAIYHYAVFSRIDGQSTPGHLLPVGSHIAVYGFLGVELFFMISGFVICMSSWDRGLRHFFASRARRLYPAYWTCVIITAAVAAAVPADGRLWSMADPTPVGVAVNLTMLEEPLGVPMIDTVYWTLFVELRFYLLLAVPVLMGLNVRRVVLFCATWMTIAALSPVLSNRIVDILAVPEYAPCFVAGMLMYVIYRFGPSPMLATMLSLTYLMNLRHVAVRVKEVQPGFAVPTWPCIVVVTLTYLVLLAVALHGLDAIRWRWLTVAGAITYPLYLLHQRIGYIVLHYLYQWTAAPIWLLIIVTLCGMSLVSWFVFRTIEVPLQHRLRQRSSALR